MTVGTVAIVLAAAFILPAQPLPHQLPNGGEIKAILVAGSNSYFNYRHQADVCHAYQLLHENGIPDESIIVMMYDDIAESEDNPDKGVLINRPGGPNVYANVKKDYTGKDVNKKVFFDVLLGNKEGVNGIGSGRVLESGPNDHVFVNFVDHGGPGILCLPEEDIKASEFLAVLEKMAKNNRFAKMFLYIEACESGSMFDNLLPDDLNIFVMTAADPHESSYACFYDEKLGTYLGDVYSVKWMQDSETVNLKTESVNHQFQKVRTETNTSHVEEYGDIDIGVTKLSEVIGYRDNPLAEYNLNFTDAVSAHHVPVAILGQRIRTAKNPEERKKLEKQLHEILKRRKEVNELFSKLEEETITPTVTTANMGFLYQNMLVKRPSLTKINLACYEKALTHLNDECYNISQNPYVASQLHKLINMCDVVPETQVVDKIRSLCHGKPKNKGIV